MTLKICSSCKVPKPTLEFNKKSKHRDGLSYRCKACARESYKTYYSNNTDKVRDSSRRYKQDNSETTKLATKYYKLQNKGKVAKHSANRRSSKLNRTPIWLTADDWKWISWIYNQSRMLTNITGVKYQVDHIIPLQGKNISGLHCPTNLQIITATENLRKSNTYEV